MAEGIVAFLANGLQGDAEDARRFANFYGATTGALATAQGVRSPFDLLIRQDTVASMHILAGGGQAVIDDPSSLVSPYLVTNDADVRVAISASDASFDRIDSIVFRVRDTETTTSPSDPDADTGLLEPIPGVPSASPQAPALPTACLELAQVRVRRNTSSILSTDITDKRTFTAALGGVQPVATLPVTGNYKGRMCLLISDTTVYRHDGSSWDSVSPSTAPRGRVAMGYNHTNEPPVGSIGTDNNHYTTLQSATWTAKANRLYRVESYAAMTCDSDGSLIAHGHFFDGVGPRRLQGTVSKPALGGVESFLIHQVTFVESPTLTAASHFVELKAFNKSAVGSCHLVAAQTLYGGLSISTGSYIEVLDWGDLSMQAS